VLPARGRRVGGDAASKGTRLSGGGGGGGGVASKEGRGRWWGRGPPPVARGGQRRLEGGRKKKMSNLALYHVRNPNPRIGCGDVLIDLELGQTHYRGGERVITQGEPLTLTSILTV
jgi:hypothetical protein